MPPKVTVVEPAGGPAMPLNLHTDRFTPGTSWVNWPSNPYGNWIELESFGATFAKTPEVSMLAELSLSKDGFEAASEANAAGVQAWRQTQRLVPSRPTRKPAPTQLARP
ncbi:MAG TPA: hypothetical protein VFG73_06220 [Rhodanobacteraceae bacterium]|nr:hypothetical protein [Rhodanobacteraceae bacterium]